MPHGRLLFWLLFCLLCIASACVAILEATHKDEPPGQGSPKGTTNSRPAVVSAAPWCVQAPHLRALLVKISGQGEEAAEPHAHGWSDPACEGCLPPMHDVRRTHVDMAAVPLSKKNLRALPPRCGMLAESAPVPVASLLHLHARPRERPVTSIPQSLRLGSLLPAHQPPRNHVYGYTDDSAWPSACKPLLGPCRRSARFATVGKSQTLRPSSLRIPTQPPSRCLYP
ncbi:hypothetical protein J3E73DRAFT_434821 [Bipolaris maydis]|nr:hypothetical protein J3E73DRAFT_434821 [Bipolaris maydis]